MKPSPRIIGKTSVHLTDGTNWPLPGTKLDAIDWRLRYGTPSRSDLLTVASLIGAYEALIAHPRWRRDEIVRAIREAMDKREALAGAGTGDGNE